MGASTGAARGRTSQAKGVSTGGGVRSCTRTGARMLRGLVRDEAAAAAAPGAAACCGAGAGTYAGSGGRLARLLLPLLLLLLLLLLPGRGEEEEAAVGLRCSVKAREAEGRKDSCSEGSSGGAASAGCCESCCRWRKGEPPSRKSPWRSITRWPFRTRGTPHGKGEGESGRS